MTELSRCFVFTDREIEITIHNLVKNKNWKTIYFLFLLCLFDVLLHNALGKTGWSAAKKLPATYFYLTLVENITRSSKGVTENDSKCSLLETPFIGLTLDNLTNTMADMCYIKMKMDTYEQLTPLKHVFLHLHLLFLLIGVNLFRVLVYFIIVNITNA